MNSLALDLGVGAALVAAVLAWRFRPGRAAPPPPRVTPIESAPAAAISPAPEQANVGAVTRVAPEVTGFVESVSTGRIWGWAHAPATPDAHLTVEIWAGPQHLGSGTANMYRPDLERAGIGKGDHAFAIDIAAPEPDLAQPPITAFALLPGGEKVKLAG